jgi:hypothetical protein
MYRDEQSLRKRKEFQTDCAIVLEYLKTGKIDPDRIYSLTYRLQLARDWQWKAARFTKTLDRVLSDLRSLAAKRNAKTSTSSK